VQVPYPRKARYQLALAGGRELKTPTIFRYSTIVRSATAFVLHSTSLPGLILLIIRLIRLLQKWLSVATGFAALHREQVRSPVLCESTPPKTWGLTSRNDSTSCLC